MAAASSGGVAGEEGVAGEGHPGVQKNLGERDKDILACNTRTSTDLLEMFRHLTHCTAGSPRDGGGGGGVDVLHLRPGGTLSSLSPLL